MKAVFPGRLQPMHEGHYQALKKFKQDFDDFELVLGSADKEREEKHPLSVEERKKIIRSCFPDLEISSISDEGEGEENNKKWIRKLRDKTGCDVIITQNDLVKRLVTDYTTLELIEHDLYDPDIYSGTEVRRRMRAGGEWRYLVPECAIEEIEKHVEKVKKSGTQYTFEPGWKKEHSFYSTGEK